MSTGAEIHPPNFTIHKHGRYWAVVEAETKELVCVTLYKRGAKEVVRRLME